ncbi:MAG: UDP-N-acetylmuramoyl-L-alanyl-D-glutamate--2,6-diaminopimelate ligase [Rhodocyclaceae bacterium]|nr:UDP-N-acetylmuramoyl-L-alanyl-D-glutamate--2,6-diaminopimelate ligase [Rhodocyclaceae bacterium]
MIVAELERHGVRVAGLCADSRAVRPGDVFVAVRGHRVDGRDFIGAAIARGAAAVVHEAGRVPPLPVPSVAVPGLDRMTGELAHLVHGRPSERLRLVGVTGTNGKTSVTHWIAQALAGTGRRCALVGTLGLGFPGALAESANTTPDAIVLHRELAGFLAQGASACAMEVSSIGIEEGRVGGAAFDTAVFTNLTRDHLEYHGTMEAYGAAKAKLFDWPGLRAAVVNLDDAFGAHLAALCAGRMRVLGYSLDEEAARDPGSALGRLAASGVELLLAEGLRVGQAGLEFRVGGVPVRSPLLGRFNASNLMAVLGALLAGGLSMGDAVAALGGLRAPAGRMEAAGGEGVPLVVVDYAHTPDALEKVLATLRETARARGGRLHCVFGCGGDRDPGKRPLMGEVAEALADGVLVTSDNPRFENPIAIIDAIVEGMVSRPEVEPDRGAAIVRAVREAAPEDVVLVAGKGHEPYQEIAGVRHPFLDMDVVRGALGLFAGSAP